MKFIDVSLQKSCKDFRLVKKEPIIYVCPEGTTLRFGCNVLPSVSPFGTNK